MHNLFKTRKSVKRLYHPYSYRFFEDFSRSFSFILGENDRTKDFFAFEPKGCIAETLLYATAHNNLSYKLEQTISNTMHSLLSYGQAYIYLQLFLLWILEKSRELLNKELEINMFSTPMDLMVIL